MSLQLACALSGQLRSFVNAAGPLLDSPSPDRKKMRPIILDTASVRLCCVESITRGAVETSYLYIRMGHTTYMHLNRHCLDRASDESHKSPPPPRPTRPACAVAESRTASWPKGRGGTVGASCLPYC